MREIETMTAAVLRDSLADPSLKALGKAYLCLLEMPHDVRRARSQALLALCRDTLAAEMHMDAETVQNMFEEFSRTLQNTQKEGT
jgi:hypothetical protein